MASSTTLPVYKDDDVATQRFTKPGAHCRITTAQATHLGTRNTQQDSVFVSDTAHFFPDEPAKIFGVICDGMGGLSDGAEAGRMVIDSIVPALAEISGEDNIRQFFREEIINADKDVADAFGEGVAGTTIVVALLFGRCFHWCSVGDSRIYLIRDKEISQISRDHNYALQLAQDVADGKIAEEEAKQHPEREALISYVGSGNVSLIDASREPIILHGGDIILLCSDGLTKSLSDEEIKAVVLDNYGDLGETARLLPLVAFDTGGAKDNTSIVLIQYFE